MATVSFKGIVEETHFFCLLKVYPSRVTPFLVIRYTVRRDFPEIDQTQGRTAY